MSNPLSAFLEIAAAGGNLFNGKWNFSFTISPASNTNTKNISYLFMTVASIDTSKSSTPVVGSSSSYSNACAFTVEANDSCDRIRIGVPTNHSGTTYYLRIDGSGQNLIAAPFDDTASWLQVKDAGNGYFSLQSATGAWIYYNSSTHNFAVSGGSLAPGHFMAIKYGAVANTTLGDLAIGEVAFYVDTNYGGSQSTGKVYVFSTPVSDTSLISGMKDSISSVKTGPTTAVALFSDSQFSGKMSITDTNQPNLTKLSVGGDSLSSFEIWPLAAPTLELASGEAILYSLPNFQGLPRLLTSSQNIYSGSGQSLRVGPQTMITAYAGNNLTGNAITWFADINNLADDNAASPVKNCPASIKLTDLNQYFSGTGAINGVAELHQYPNYDGQQTSIAGTIDNIGPVTFNSLRVQPGFGIDVYPSSGFQGAATTLFENTSKTNAPLTIGSVRAWTLLNNEENTYFSAEAVLMQDYWQTNTSISNALTEMRVYRVVINPLQFVEGMTVNICATEDIDVMCNGSPTYMAAGANFEFPFAQMNSKLQLTLSIDANQKLSTAPLRVRTSNMPPNTYVILFPDEQLHKSMAQVTPDDLPAQISGDANRAAIATTVQNMATSMLDNYSSHSTTAPGRATSMRLSAGALHRRDIDTGSTPSWSLDFSSGSAVYTELTHVQAKAVRDVVNGVAPNSGPVFSSQIAGSAAWQIIMENPAQIQHISLLTNDGSHANASHGNTTQRNWFSNLWHKFVAVITTVAGEIYTFVLDSVAAVGDFIMSVLNKAGLLISQAIDWLSALFNWNDILQVQDQLETGFNECMQGLSDGMAAMRSSFDSFMDSSIVSIDEAIDSLISQVQPADEQATLGSTLAPAKDGAIQAQYRSVQAQWGTATLTDHVNATQSTLPPVTLSSGMDTIIDNLINRLNALINNPQYSAPFNQAKQDLMNYFKNPDAVPNILNLGIIDLLNIIKSITNLAMETLKLVIDTLFDYAQQAIALMCRLLNQPLTIPVLSPLYSSITTSSQYPQGKTLSFLSLGALLIAIPTTVTYKLIHGVHAFENGARTARTENPYLNLLVYPIVGAYSRLLIGVTDAWLDRQSLIPQPAAVPDTALELVASLLNWFGTGIAQWMDQKLSGRSMMELLTFSSTGLNEDNPEEVARFFESLCWDYRWAYVAADAICFGVELGRSSVKRYRLMRNTNDPVTGFPIGAVIHTLMACPMLAFQVGKLTQDIIVVNSRTYENAEHKRELLAAASLNGAGNILDTFTDFAEAPYRMINIDLRETSVVQPETAPAMEAANIALNVAIVGIDIGVRVLAGVIAAITPSLVALGTEPEPE